MEGAFDDIYLLSGIERFVKRSKKCYQTFASLIQGNRDFFKMSFKRIEPIGLKLSSPIHGQVTIFDNFFGIHSDITVNYFQLIY